MTAPESTRQALQDAVAGLQAQRAMLGDALVDAALGPLLARLAALDTEPVSSPAPPVRQLRQVSVLFLDIVGSTTLVERLDPEDVQAVVDGALAAFSTLVTRHGGEVLSFAGDNVKAAFGSRGTREDDAERAVHCGLALLREAARWGDKVLREHGHAGFNARVGIHTGPAISGGGVEQENSLSGLTVYVAARMEQTAPPGALRISLATYRQVQDCFEVQEQPALQVKGLSEPLQTYLVHGERERRLRGLHRGLEGETTALVGREAEMQQLLALASTLSERSRLEAITLLGEAGLGKSRLLAEIQAALPAPTRAGALWRASGHPQGLHQPGVLLRDLLFWHHGIKDSDTQAQAQQKLAVALAPLFGAAADEQTALLGQLIGLDYSASPFIAGILRDGRQLRARGFHAFVEYLRLQSRQQPLVLVLDDLHWADDESLDAIEHLAAAGAALPMRLLCAARPELLQRRPDWGENWSAHRRCELGPLDGTAGDVLADALLQRLARPSPRLRSLLAAQAGGNPYYMEALLQMLVDTGVIRTEAGRWQVQDDRLQALEVPSTLVGVLQATLDTLEAAERRSLQLASVIGAQFWDLALAAIDPVAPRQLPALGERNMALPQPLSAFEGAQEYTFRHHLLHQVTYDTVLKPDKREGHRRAAQWLQGRGHGREAELASQIADHFERAGDPEQAVAYGLRAAEDASRRQADSAALAHADRALALDDGSDLRRQVRLHRVRAQVFLRAGKAAAHRDEVALLASLAERLDDDVLRLSLATDQMWRLCLDTAFAEAVELGERRLKQANGRAPADAARAHNVMFVALSRLGRFDEALVHGQRGLVDARAVGDGMTEGAIFNNIAVNHQDAHRVAAAQEALGQALRAYTAAGSRHGALTVSLNLARTDELLGRFGPARDRLLLMLRDCHEMGALGQAAMAHANLAPSLCELGDPQGAYEHAMQALHLAQGAGDRWAQALAQGGARMAAQALGRLDEALALARAAAAGCTEHGQQAMAWEHAGAEACLLLWLGQPAQALASAETVLAEVAGQGGWGDCVDGPMHLFKVFSAVGDPRAASALAAAHRGLRQLAERYVDLVPTATFVRATQMRREICDAADALGPT